MIEWRFDDEVTRSSSQSQALISDSSNSFLFVNPSSFFHDISECVIIAVEFTYMVS